MGFWFLWDTAPIRLEDVGEDESDDDQPLARIPGNVLFAPRVDQLAVLASGRIHGFVSHCGLNSIHEAMHFGIPVVAVPFIGDQFVTARLVVEKGAGLRLSTDATSKIFSDTVKQIVLDEAFRSRA